MNGPANTLFLRLEGPLQAWGGDSRFVIRDTAEEPVKSGVLGLICGCMGLRRERATERLPKLNALRMGVRIDRPGTRWADYHTVGARYGVMAAEGKIKRTGNTQHSPIETLVTRRFYLCDASFLVALQGEPDTIAKASQALTDPVWPPFLGRKCCPPSTPIHVGTGSFHSLKAALASQPWRCRVQTEAKERPIKLRLVLEWERYVEGLATVLKPSGKLFLLCFSDEEPGTQGPRRVSKEELYAAFAEGWIIETIEPSRFEVRPDLKDLSFSEGGPKAWFAVIRRAR